eukprot:13092483-Alexandrium_andersonii.AAC.1
MNGSGALRKEGGLRYPLGARLGYVAINALEHFVLRSPWPRGLRRQSQPQPRALRLGRRRRLRR